MEMGLGTIGTAAISSKIERSSVELGELGRRTKEFKFEMALTSENAFRRSDLAYHPTVGKGNTINESEMALFFECMQSCARKGLDTGRHCQRRDVTTVTRSLPFLKGRTIRRLRGLLRGEKTL